MRRGRHLKLVLALLALGALAPSCAAAATWQFAPAEAPPAPPGVAQQALPVPVGKVGAISFWAPNRGVLIDEGTATGGCRTANATAGVPCGLYAYNGRSWHLLSTVCGGGEGRIAWGGPEDFWTISDRRPNFVEKPGPPPEPRSVSLCHFHEGKFVASYATPFEQSNSYRKMDAAACLAEDDCWFAGALGEPPQGGFHLHWDGHNLTAIYSPVDHAVSSMAVAGPETLLESVELNPNAPGDSYLSEIEANPEARPFLLHRIDAGGEFPGVLLNDPSCSGEKICPPLPNYGGLAPDSLSGFQLSSDYTSLNPEPQLWAVAGRPSRPLPPGEAAHATVLRFSGGTWTQALDESNPGAHEPGQARNDLEAGLEQVAAEPGSPAAWVTVTSGDGEAHVDRVTAEGAGTKDFTGTIEQKDVLGEAQHAGQLGESGPIACPAQNDCWLATSKGWLFHLTEVPEAAHEPGRTEGYPEDTDPAFSSVISFRPLDEGVPQLPPNEPPPDTSLANQLPAPIVPITPGVVAPLTIEPALIVGLHSRVIHRDMLELTFKLIATAHVQLIASRNGHRVAQTRRETMKAGKRRLALRLNPRRWPDKLDLKATPLHPLTPITAPAGTGGQTKSAPISSNSVES